MTSTICFQFNKLTQVIFRKQARMGAEVPFIVLTVFWAAVGGLGPFLVPRRGDRGLYQMMIILTAVCCYLFWIIVFLHQWHPLVGPTLKHEVYRAMQIFWTTYPNNTAPHQ